MATNKYEIAGLKILMRANFPHMINQGKAYLKEFEGEADLVIDFTDEELKEKRATLYPNADDDLMEYMMTSARFYYRFIGFNGMMLHSSCVVVDGKAYFFSAPSGTGKSTHVSLWLKNLEGRAFILNDDKPALRLENGQFFAYGTPWSGKTDKNTNGRYPVGAIAFIERSEQPFIEKMPPFDALKNIYWQTIKPKTEKNVERLFPLCEELIKKVPIYRFGANISKEAFVTSFEEMTGTKFE